MSAPKFIRVAGKLYRRADDASPYTDTIKETEGRDCGCRADRTKKVSVQPEEASIAAEEFAMQGFETAVCAEGDAVCVTTPPPQPEAVPHVRAIGGDTITSQLRRNWPSEALKSYNGSTAPTYIMVRGQVYKKLE